MVLFRPRCTAIRLNASLASLSDLAPIMSLKLLRLMQYGYSFLTP